MGYTTDFYGEGFKFNKPVDEKLRDFINAFSESRRMKRDNEKIKEFFPDWEKKCFNGNLGNNGEYFVGGDGVNTWDLGRKDTSIIDYNCSGSCPSLWCQWIVDDDTGNLTWDGGEKFYHYGEWLQYLLDNFIIPSGYTLSGAMEFQGEDMDDNGVIDIVDGTTVRIRYFKKYLSDEDTRYFK